MKLRWKLGLSDSKAQAFGHYTTEKAQTAVPTIREFELVRPYWYKYHTKRLDATKGQLSHLLQETQEWETKISLSEDMVSAQQVLTYPPLTHETSLKPSPSPPSGESQRDWPVFPGMHLVWAWYLLMEFFAK